MPLARREQRGLALIAVALVALGVFIVIYLRPATASSPAAQPDLLSDMDWLSAREGWLTLFDRPAGRTVLLHTADGGVRWSRLHAADGLENVDFFDPARGVLVHQPPPGQDGAAKAFATSDGGRHWRPLPLPDEVAGGRPSFADPGHGRVWQPSPPGLYATDDGGATWRLLDATGLPGVGGAPGALGFATGARGWAAGPAGTPTGPNPPAVYRTSDGGETWTASALPTPEGGWPPGSTFDIGPVTVAPDGRGQALLTELEPWEYRQVVLSHWVASTADGGATWSAPRRVPGVPPRTGVGLSVGAADGTASWAWSANELLTTRDGGATWTTLAVPRGWIIDRVRAIDGTAAWVAATVASGRGAARWRLFSTGDGGASWKESRLPALR